MRAGESIKFLNKAAGTLGPFTLQGGWYELAAVATWGGGNVALSTLGPDGTTFLAVELIPDAAPGTPAATITANGKATFWAAPGQYRLIFTTGSAGNFSVTRIPRSE